MQIALSFGNLTAYQNAFELIEKLEIDIKERIAMHNKAMILNPFAMYHRPIIVELNKVLKRRDRWRSKNGKKAKKK